MKGLKRLLIILGAFLFNVVFLVCLEIIIELLDDSSIRINWSEWIFIAAIIVGTQVIFILPLVRPPTAAMHGKSLALSMLIAAFIASLCTFALVTFVFSLVMTMFFDFHEQDEMKQWFVYSFLACSWIFWSVLLLIFVQRNSHDSRPLVRLTGLLFASSLVEFLLAIPLTIMVKRRSDCYCETGSFFALIASFIAALWLFGPFMVILLFWRKRPWHKDHCLVCGYPRKVTGVCVCNECGVKF